MYDMNMQLHTGGSRRLYEQIYEHIRNEIKEGKLLQGERLPSTRSLAEYLQVARSTVDFAYAQLVSEGYIEARPYRGYFVCRLEELLEPEQGKGTVQALGGSEEKEPESEERDARISPGGYVCNFNPNGIDMSVFPFGVWQRITRNVLSFDNYGLFALGEPQGDRDLRVTVSRYLHSARGVNCRPEQIIVGAGNDYLLMLLEKILGRHVKIAMENPTYKRAYRIFDSFAYHIVSVDMDNHGMIAEELEQADVTAAYVMPSHQYPTGTVMPIGRRMELLKWAADVPGRYLIEDDYDSEFRYRGKPIPSLQASDKNGSVIYIGTFSKAIAPAIRVSYMVLPETLLHIYKEKCYFYSSTVSRIDQRILNEFISQGYFERYLNKVRKLYREKHDVMLEQLKPFLKDFVLSGEHAGLHMLLTSKKGLEEKELIRRAAERGIKVYGMSEAYILQETQPSPESHTVILGYGSLSAGQIKAGMEALKEAWLL